MAGKPLQARGLSLLELLIALVIASILTLWAVPNLRPFIQNNRSITQINELQTSLNAARTEAIVRNNNITLCPVNKTGDGCHEHLDHWHHGWITFVDSDLDGALDGEEILHLHGKAGKQRFITFSDMSVISFASSGLATAGANSTFTLCDDRGAASARGLIVGVSGRPRLAVDSNSNGILEDESNTDLVCAP